MNETKTENALKIHTKHNADNMQQIIYIIKGGLCPPIRTAYKLDPS